MQKDVEGIKKRAELLSDMIFLANNFIAHQNYMDEHQERQTLIVMEGLDHTYLKLIQIFADFEN